MIEFAWGFIAGAVVASLIALLGREQSDEKETTTFVGKTVVYLRQNKAANCRFWESTVKYDAWGSPYVKDHCGWFMPISLHRDGSTSHTLLYGTEWKWKSGDEVKFGSRPRRPFDDDEQREFTIVDVGRNVDSRKWTG